MVQMCYALVLALAAPASTFRVDFATDAVVKQEASSCACSDTGVVDGVATNKAGCAIHFGQRLGYICYVDQGSECAGARKSKRLGVYWRSCRSEHLAETAKGFLLDAMDGIDLDSLERTIRIAESKHVDQETLDAATARVDVVIEMCAARDELLAAVQGFDVVRLQTALEETERLELDEFISDETLDAASARLDYLDQGLDADAELRAAIVGTDVDELRASIQNVARFHNSHELMAEGRVRLQELIAQIAAAEDALAAVVGGTDPDALEDAIVEAGRLRLSPEAIASATNRLDALYVSQTAEEDLLQAIQGENRAVLADTLATAQDAGIDIDAVLRAGQERVAALQVMADESADQLIQMVEGSDPDGLHSAIARARKLDSVSSQVLADAELRWQHLEGIDAATSDLQAAIDGDSMGELQHKLRRARQLGVSPSVIAAGEAGASRLRIRMHDAEVDVVRLTQSGTDADELQDAIDLVRRLNAASHATINRAVDKVAQLRQ